ncbi:MAG: GAF domain-containing sensor histidine kinase [Solirubrobacteraceae bacterium]|nr:GAF domain-containing sensor histidine kinase [Solirubrobacteraceae bacterium]
MPTPEAQIRRLENLLEVGRSLTSELNLDSLLDTILETARELTGARFAAIGVLDDRRRALEQFLTSGIPPEAHARIGDLPRGRGILGVLIDDPRPLQLHDVSDDPRSFGFPAGHPPMRSFLGAPISIRGEAWGNLYLTEKDTGEDFDHRDLETVQVLAQWAAVAIENARLFAQGEAQRDDLERAMRGLEATVDVALAIGDATDLDRVLTLIARRARGLVEAGTVVVALLDDGRLRIAARDDDAVLRVIESPADGIDANGPIAALAVRGGDSAFFGKDDGIADEARAFGVPSAATALVVPLQFRGETLGVLVAFDHLGDRPDFAEDDARAVRSLAASAATAVTTARSVEAGRLRATISAAEGERKRWARELHDETLQGLGALKLALRGALRVSDDDRRTAMIEGVVQQLDTEIASLRAIIRDLRPAALDDLGLEAALRTLGERTQERAGLTVETDLDLGGTVLDPELEIAAYRVIQEALTNVVKHAGATRVRVTVRIVGVTFTARVVDDGAGLGVEAAQGDERFGITGMRERAELVGGTVAVRSQPGRTEVELVLPAR